MNRHSHGTRRMHDTFYNSSMKKPYNALSDYMKEQFGCKVFKVSIDGGFTCPNRDGVKGRGGCIYCSASTLLPKGGVAGADVTEQLASGVSYVRERHKAVKFIAYYQLNSSTYAPPEVLKELYAPALRHPDVVGIAISTRPDCVDEETLNLLAGMKEFKHVWLELGLQSASDATLARLNRMHTVRDFERAAELAGERGIDVCAHVILGLPGEERADMLSTMRFLSDIPVWGIKFHQLQVIRGTALHKMYESGDVRLLTLEDYASLVVDSIELLPPMTVIHRLAGDAPENLLIAPRWGANKFMIMEKIVKTFAERKTFQGKDFY